jgi:nicotinate phosphoribosyltransferase
MIQSILDTDLYKLTMGQAILELFPEAQAEYTFINRGTERFNEKFLTQLKSEICNLSRLSLTEGELDWLRFNCSYLKPWYLEYLRSYWFDSSEVEVELTADKNLQLTIRGLWHRTVYWEVPLLALISELYYRIIDTNWTFNKVEYLWQLSRKMSIIGSNKVSDFGTRRRRSFEAQDLVVSKLSLYPNFVGTSNVFLAYYYNTKPMGTVAHEWTMAMSVLEGLRNANYYALENWARVYKADLGTALSDTYGMEAFLRNFNLRLAKLYDGVRHDSGSSFLFIDKMVKHYMSLGINPKSKYLIFSDNLTAEKCILIEEHCQGKIQYSFGIGTNLTNDFLGSKALNIVIKMSKMNGIPVVKLSDEPGKECGDREALRVAKWVFFNTPLDS